MAQTPWHGDAQELAGSSDQIPEPPISVGMSYDLRPIYCCSPSDFVARNWSREQEYVQLKTELDEIYRERPSWLRIREEDAPLMVPIAYVNSDDQTGRGYIFVHETRPEVVVFDVDEGMYLDVDIANIFYLGKDHAQVPAFAIQCGVRGIKPPSGNLWSREICESFADLINTPSIHFQPAIISGETFMGDGISRRDGWSLQTWLMFTGRGIYNPGYTSVYPHLEAH